VQAEKSSGDSIYISVCYAIPSLFFLFRSNGLNLALQLKADVAKALQQVSKMTIKVLQSLWALVVI